MYKNFLQTSALTLGLGLSIISLEGLTNSLSADMKIGSPNAFVTMDPPASLSVRAVVTKYAAAPQWISGETPVTVITHVPKNTVDSLNNYPPAGKSPLLWSDVLSNPSNGDGVNITYKAKNGDVLWEQTVPFTAWEDVPDGAEAVDVLNATLLNVLSNGAGGYQVNVGYPR